MTQIGARTDSLAAAILRVGAQPGARLREAVVVDNSPLTISLGGSSVAVPAVALASYLPAIGDFVAVITEGADLVVLGSLEGAWQTWSAPVLRQSGVVTKTTNLAQYRYHAGAIDVVFKFTCTGSGTAANAVLIEGLPADIDADWAAADAVVGIGNLFDGPTTAHYPSAALFADTSTQIAMRSIVTAGTTGRLGQSAFTAALASGDIVEGRFSYRPA